MKKLFRITTVAESLSILLKGQLGFLNDYYEVRQGEFKGGGGKGGNSGD